MPSAVLFGISVTFGLTVWGVGEAATSKNPRVCVQKQSKLEEPRLYGSV